MDCLFVLSVRLVAVLASMSVASSLAKAQDRPLEKLSEFLVKRDRWLYDEALKSQSPFEIATMKRPVLDEVQLEQVRMAETEKLLPPIRARIKKNTGKPSLAKILARDVEREKNTLTTIDKHRRRIEDLQGDLAREEKAVKDRMLQEKQRKEDHERFVVENAKAKRDQLRRDMKVMPPHTPKLDPASFSVGSFGLLPRWPTGARLNVYERQNATNIGSKIDAGNELRQAEIDFLESKTPGGVLAAKKKANLRVVQVFDGHHLLVSLIGGERDDWPLFLIDIDDTNPFADDSIVRMDALLVIAGTHTYKSVNGAARTVFVMSEVKTDDLPTGDD